MNNENEELYSEWIRRRQSIPVPEGFAEQVMREVAKQSAIKRFELPDAYRFFSRHSVQWAAAAGALLLGLFRLSYIATALLMP